MFPVRTNSEFEQKFETRIHMPMVVKGDRNMHHETSESDKSENYLAFSDTEYINKRLQGKYISGNCVHLQTYQTLRLESSTPPKMPIAEKEETNSNTKTWSGLSPLVLPQQRTEESNTISTLFNDDEDVATTIHYNQVKMNEADLSQIKKQCV